MNGIGLMTKICPHITFIWPCDPEIATPNAMYSVSCQWNFGICARHFSRFVLHTHFLTTLN